MILLTLILIPLFGVAIIAPSYQTHQHLPILQNQSHVDPDTKIKYIALTVSIIAFLYSLILLVLFDPSTPDYQFTFHLLTSKSFSSDFQMGVDGISIYFVILTTFLFPISFLASWKISSSTTLGGNKYNVKFYLCTMLLLETLLILLFVVTDIMLFYIFF